MKRTIQSIALAAAFAIGAVPMFAGTGNPPAQDLASQVRHELVMIPYYSVFDDLNYSVDNARCCDFVRRSDQAGGEE